MQGHNNGFVPHWRMKMFRKLALGLIAAASLGIAALAPGSASANGFHHHHHGHHGWGFGGVYVNTGINNCYQQRWVQTRHGLRLRVVNVCAYGLY
jgi:hypothetical protein